MPKGERTRPMRGKEILAGNVPSAIRYWLRVLDGWGRILENDVHGGSCGRRSVMNSLGSGPCGYLTRCLTSQKNPNWPLSDLQPNAGKISEFAAKRGRVYRNEVRRSLTRVDFMEEENA